VSPGKPEVLERERAWSLPVALMTLFAIGLVVLSMVANSSVGGDGDAEVLGSVDEHSSTVILAGILQGLGFLLLGAPLLYLFRAAQARSEQVREKLVGLVIATPLFLCVASVLLAVAVTSAASDFEAGRASADLTRSEATKECRSERSSDAAAFKKDFGGGGNAIGRCTDRKIADDEAEGALADAPTRLIGFGFGLAGRLGLAFSLLYGCLWAMRTGLLTRFWGSLGMAMGVAAFFLRIEFPLIFFFYFGLLVAGWVPGGRPPAWAAGEAIPWPTPGERTSEALGGSDDEGPVAGEELVATGDADESVGQAGGKPRKRKRRD
jgi:hypothetical protein